MQTISRPRSCNPQASPYAVPLCARILPSLPTVLEALSLNILVYISNFIVFRVKIFFDIFMKAIKISS